MDPGLRHENRCAAKRALSKPIEYIRSKKALVRAALMNTAGAGQYEARWILSTDLSTMLLCPPQPDPLNFVVPIHLPITLPFCGVWRAERQASGNVLVTLLEQ